MYSSVLFNFKITLKYIKFKYLSFKILKKKVLLIKKIYLKFLKKNILYIISKSNQTIFLKKFFKKLWNFLLGFKIFFNILGRRFKFFINKDFIFFKMDTSKYFVLKMLKNVKLIKQKKIISFFFFDVLTFQFWKKILKLKIPTKYTKKGIALYNF